MSRGAAGEGLPALHDHIDIGGVELDPMAHAAGHLGGDQARARAEKRVIDRLTGPSVVGDRPAHAFNRFLRPVPQLSSRSRLPNGLLLGISQTVVCARSPFQWLLLPWRTAYQQVSCCQ